MVDFGNKLRTLRTQAGMSQSELAKRLNITKSVISYYELQERTPSSDVLIRLADIFHVSTDYLYGITHEKMIDVSDLTEEDFRFLLLTVETLRKKKKNKQGYIVMIQPCFYNFKGSYSFE